MARPTLRPRRLPPLAKALVLALALSAAPPVVPPSAALDAAIVKGLKELDLSARLEQRCDIEAMSRIAKDKQGYRPDRVVAGATADAKIEGDFDRRRRRRLPLEGQVVPARICLPDLRRPHGRARLQL